MHKAVESININCHTKLKLNCVPLQMSKIENFSINIDKSFYFAYAIYARVMPLQIDERLWLMS